MGGESKPEISPLVTENLSASPDTHVDEHEGLVLPALPTPSNGEPINPFPSTLESSKSGRRSTDTCVEEDRLRVIPPSPTLSQASIEHPSPSNSRQPQNATLASTDKGTVVDRPPLISHLCPVPSNSNTTTTSARSLIETLNLPTPTNISSTSGSLGSRRSRVSRSDGAALASLIIAVPTLLAPSVGGTAWTPPSPGPQNDPPKMKRPLKWWKSLKATIRKYSPTASGVA